MHRYAKSLGEFTGTASARARHECSSCAKYRKQTAVGVYNRRHVNLATGLADPKVRAGVLLTYDCGVTESSIKSINDEELHSTYDCFFFMLIMLISNRRIFLDRRMEGNRVSR